MSDSPTSPPPPISGPRPPTSQAQPPISTPKPPTRPTAGAAASAPSEAQRPPLGPTIDRLTSRTTAATALASIGALLVVIAAGTFIAVSWDHLGLSGKAGVVAAMAAAAIGGGYQLRNRLPGIASVLTHLGAALVPLDIGGITVAFGADRPTTGVIAGLAGVVSFTVLDAKLRRHSAAVLSRDARLADHGAVGGHAMAVGRVISASAFLLGLSAVVDLRPAVMILGIAVALVAVRAAWESIGLAVVAAAGPVARWAGNRSLDGSFFAELAEISAASPAETTIVAACSMAIIAAASLRHREHRLGFVAGVLVAASAAGDAAAVFVDHQRTTLIFVAAILLAARGLIWFYQADRWSSALDVAVILASIVGGFIGLAGIDNGVVQPDVGIGIAAALFAASWFVSDASSNVSVSIAQRIWTGASGPVSSIGLAIATAVAALATGSALWAAITFCAAAVAIGLAPRMPATTAAVSMTMSAVAVSLIDPGFHVLVGLAAAIILQGRATISFGTATSQSTEVAVEQWLGVGLAILTLAVTPLYGPQGLVHAALAFATAGALAFAAHAMVGRPDFGWPPRLLMIAATIPAVEDSSQAGIALTIVGAALVAEAFVRNQRAIGALGAPAMVLGSWLWASGEGLEAAEWYLAAPALLVFAYGFIASRDGASSWGGMPIGIALFAGAALLERIDSALLHDNIATSLDGSSYGATSGWHAIAAGIVSIVALTLGVEKKWQGPTATGLVLLAATVVIEAGAVVPLIPVWVLLGTGGLILLGAGFALERGAQGTAQAADPASAHNMDIRDKTPLTTLQATWAEFR